ncbi:MAG: anti-sigma factor domain-containing protein [Candidatus Acidiferrales bacterium]
MVNFRVKQKSPAATAESQECEHEHYAELCALATTGTLADEEWTQLRSHLGQCAECRALIHEYREVARSGMPMMMQEATVKDEADQQTWSPEGAKRELFSRLARGEEAGWRGGPAEREPEAGRKHFWAKLGISDWHSALRYAAMVTVVVAAIPTIYHYGFNRGQQFVHTRSITPVTEIALLQNQIDGLTREKNLLDQELAERTGEIDGLSNQMRARAAELGRWKRIETKAEQDLQQQGTELAETKAERDAARRKLQSAEISLVSTQKTLDRLREERTSELLRTASLETRINELSTRLKNNDAAADAQQLLASDRDIRELMGARDLYIADVFDVDTDGRTRKPFGRVFYTKQKSLVFYAFDLDQQHGVGQKTEFQAWGRRGMSDPRPVNMGVFYLDSETSRRWVLKFENSDALARIDAVFVTVEPKGGSQQPRGKQLLFASLRAQPNHP